MGSVERTGLFCYHSSRTQLWSVRVWLVVPSIALLTPVCLLVWVEPSAIPKNSKTFAFSLFLHLMLFRNNFNCTTPDFFHCWINGVDLETVKRDLVYYLGKLSLYIGILCIKDWDEFHKETIQSGLTKV